MADIKKLSINETELDSVTGGNNNMESLKKCPKCKTFQKKSDFSAVNGYCRACNDELSKSGQISKRGV